MSWTHEERSAIWAKGKIVQGNDPNVWRQDVCGAWIGWRFYGDRNSQYGWEADHIEPYGGDKLSNLRPLQWQNNAAKSDGRLVCVITSVGGENASTGRTART